MKHRLLRVRELLKRELSDIIQKEFQFENALVTINDVDITPDLKQGHVFIGVIGGDKERENAVRKLNENHGQIQKRMSKRVVLKYTPQLHFKLDDSVARGVNVISIMDQLEPASDLETQEDTEE